MERNLTFGELNELINKWIADTLSMNQDFFRQSEEIKEQFIKVKNNVEKIENVHCRLNVLRTFSEMMEENLNLIDDTFTYIGNIVCQLLNCPEISTDIIQNDPARMNIYTNAERINEILSKMKIDYGAVNSKIQLFDNKLQSNDPMENIGKIMMSQLYLLEGIECSNFELFAMLRETERKYELLLAKNCHRR